MRVNPKIFKAYDIRGIYPEEIDEKTAYLIGGAFVKFLGVRNAKVAVGCDNRLSSPALRRNLVKGITEAGADVVNIGLATTPMLYFSVARYGYDGGVNVTASHNSREYNGFKLVGRGASPISGKTGLREIRAIAAGSEKFSSSRKGRVAEKGVVGDYLDFNFKNVNLGEIGPLKIVMDTANAVCGVLIPGLRKRLPGKIYPLFEKMDGAFPNHSPDPLKEENLKALQKAVRTRRADLGVAFDGDGDRIVFLDEKGRAVSGDLICALVSESVLRENPGAKILYDLRSTRAVRETVKKEGGVPVVWRVGHSFIKEKMRKENILFGGEFSGHYYHRDHYFAEAPLFVLFRVLKNLSGGGRMSEAVRPFKRYFHSGEINLKAEDKEEILKKLERKYRKGKVLKIDGLRVDFKDWWFLARPSNTEPVLRLMVEADSKSLMEKKKKELIGLIA